MMMMRVARRGLMQGRHYQTVAVDNPYTGDTFCEINLSDQTEAAKRVASASTAYKSWRTSSLADRIQLCERFMDEMEKNKDQVARDISGMMGKPLQQSYGEIKGMYQRVRGMIAAAPEALASELVEDSAEGYRSIQKVPVGVVLIIAPWNYPLLTSINTVVPAILAGNSVIIKQSYRTPLCANHFEDAFASANAPEGLVTALHADHDVTGDVIADERVGFVAFTGSVRGGHEVYQKVSRRFIDATLELGGKDPAYVAADADPKSAAEGLIDGAFYNAGQSCCGIERVYVHESHYDAFLEHALPIVEGYKLGDPSDPATSLGPMALPGAPAELQAQVDQARERGARVLCGGHPTTDSKGFGRFFAPTLVADCKQDMDIIQEESFGPVLGVMPVKSDEEALSHMNDSKYGLTAAVFTSSKERAMSMASRLECGTVFMNRCDNLDPELPW
eukprot:CAMPEP_0119133228 /NCGR_PEP_ID=MMETSP1310-20130426/13267_1 /TAXON_ID=464262 /ORGANISM="Genus nov. species nov., Strain RCC2339" /LENGTH=446 /DNA_ID=CAMNT_0007123915 /DNA_START=48 /DNA_END=1385 /DNA_ORIENTATION=+